MGYKEDLKIDKNSLDDECLKQPYLYEKYATHYQEAVAEKDSAKLKMEETKSLIDKGIRLDIKLSGNKRTEKAIESEILLNETHKESQELYYMAKKHADSLSVLREAFLQKKDMLKLLVELYLGNYFSTIEIKTQKEDSREAVRRKIKLSRKGT